MYLNSGDQHVCASTALYVFIYRRAVAAMRVYVPD